MFQTNQQPPNDERTNQPANQPKQLTHLVEFGELINRLVANQCLADEQCEVGFVDMHELGKRPHQRLIVLHSSGSVDQHYVVALVFAWVIAMP